METKEEELKEHDDPPNCLWAYIISCKHHQWEESSDENVMNVEKRCIKDLVLVQPLWNHHQFCFIFSPLSNIPYAKENQGYHYKEVNKEKDNTDHDSNNINWVVFNRQISIIRGFRFNLLLKVKKISDDI